MRIPILDGWIAPAIIGYARNRGYDALMLTLENLIIGHTAFQIRQDRSLHVFSTAIKDQYAGKGLGTFLLVKMIEVARKLKINDVRCGAGGHEFAKKAYSTLCDRSEELRITPGDDYWIRIDK
ncbi:MAG: GNAT family N-acetyltransferase [Nanoarchaeota archaeon]